MSRRCSNSCSLRIGTSSFSALLTLEAPGEEPATTAAVLRGPKPGSEVLVQQAFGLDLTDAPRYVIELYLSRLTNQGKRPVAWSTHASSAICKESEQWHRLQPPSRVRASLADASMPVIRDIRTSLSP